MSILSKQAIAASIADFSVKKLLDDHTTVATVAAAGSLISDGTPLAYGRNVVTGADATKAVVLPDAKLNSMVEVVNTVSNAALVVFPKLAGDQINAITAGAAFTQAAGSRAAYFCDAAGHWYVAAANLTGVATSASQAELDVLDGALDTNLVAAKAAILGTGGALTLGGALTAVTSIGIGSAVLTEAEMEMLDTITAGTQAANKAVVANSDVNIGVVKATQLHIGSTGAETQVNATGAELNDAADRSTQVVAAGAGFTAGTGALHYSGVQKVGTLIKTTIFIDLTGTASSTTDLDIIGDNGTATGSHIGQITAALNGTIFFGTVTCLETPAGGIDDIIFYYADESTGTFDGAVSALTGETVMYNKTSGHTAAAATQIAFVAVPPANKYMYLVNGAAGTAADYTAGQFLIELWGA